MFGDAIIKLIPRFTDEELEDLVALAAAAAQGFYTDINCGPEVDDVAADASERSLHVYRIAHAEAERREGIALYPDVEECDEAR